MLYVCMYIYILYIYIYISWLLCMHIYIYIICIYIYRGEAWGSQARGVGGLRINVLWTALEERCCDGEDVVTLKMLLCWRCCYVEDVEDVYMLKMFKMLLCWRCCYVEDVATLKVFLRWRCWRCCYVEKRECAFRPWFSGELWHFYWVHEDTEILSARNSTGFYENNMKWRTWKT